MIIRLFLFFLAFCISNPTFAQERTVPGSQTQMQLSFAPLVREISPAVVNIYTKRVVSRRFGGGFASPFANDPFFSQFFNDNMFGSRMRQQVESSLGSGVIIEAGGLVVTNAHVIRDAQEITIGLNDGREFDAELALSDKASDLALLRLQNVKEELPHATLKPSESLQVGDLVLAIGNPFGVGQTVTSGIVSALARSSLDINDFNFFIQTDAAINPGNSGGPLVALDGGVVGINSAIYSRDGGSLGIGFAIPSEMVASVIAAAKDGRSGEQGAQRPWLGITAQSVTSDIGESLGLARPWGALISALHPQSPLLKAGMKVGDVVQVINGREIRDASEMKFRMATVPLGGKADFTVVRAGKHLDFAVTAITPPDSPPRDARTLGGDHPLSGAVIANVNPAVAEELGMNVNEEKGVVVTSLEPSSPAARLVRPGDMIRAVNGQAAETTKDVQSTLKQGGNAGWSFVFERDGQTRQIVLR